jgi:hypothetical protein
MMTALSIICGLRQHCLLVTPTKILAVAMRIRDFFSVSLFLYFTQTTFAMEKMNKNKFGLIPEKGRRH